MNNSKLHPTLAALSALLPTMPDAAMRLRIERAITTPVEALSPLPDQIISPRDVARALACTPKTVHRLASQGELHRVRLPGRKRGHGFLASEVSRLLIRCAGGAA